MRNLPDRGLGHQPLARKAKADDADDNDISDEGEQLPVDVTCLPKGRNYLINTEKGGKEEEQQCCAGH